MATISTKLLTPPEWTEQSVCAQVDPALFFPRKGGATHAAKKICSGCPVVEQCLAWALDYEAGDVTGADWHASYGVYGGRSARERRLIIRDRAALREAS
jgi:WhiB family redox-sensing transcriptional regulator